MADNRTKSYAVYNKNNKELIGIFRGCRCAVIYLYDTYNRVLAQRINRCARAGGSPLQTKFPFKVDITFATARQMQRLKDKDAIIVNDYPPYMTLEQIEKKGDSYYKRPSHPCNEDYAVELRKLYETFHRQLKERYNVTISFEQWQDLGFRVSQPLINVNNKHKIVLVYIQDSFVVAVKDRRSRGDILISALPERGKKGTNEILKDYYKEYPLKVK